MISFFGPPFGFMANLLRPERLIVMKQYKLCKIIVMERLSAKKKKEKYERRDDCFGLTVLTESSMPIMKDTLQD